MTIGTLTLIKSEIHIIQARGNYELLVLNKVILGLKWAVGQVEGRNLNDENLLNALSWLLTELNIGDGINYIKASIVCSAN